MADFQETARRLHEVRTASTNSVRDLHRVSEELKQVDAALERLGRRALNDKESRRRAEGLEDRKKVLTTRHRDLTTAARDILTDAEVLERDFLPFTDPRKSVSQKDAAIPFLLFPLRLETRWKKVVVDDEIEDQLWVRVFPDDCLVDTFEATPSEGELKALDTFWVNWARAGGDRNQRRGAWRTFVAGFGSGRSAWLIEQYVPANLDEIPVKADPADVILVVTARPPLPDGERGDAAAFWSTVWKSGSDAQTVEDAAADLANALGDARATEVIARYRPTNFDDNPTRPHTRADVAVQVAFLELPDRELVASQRTAWTQPPKVSLLPERLVLLGFRAGRSQPLTVLGNPIPPDLQVGPDPLAPEAEQMHLDDHGDLVVGAGMKWMVDFEEAVAKGMAFRIRMTAEDVRLGFDRLLVLGVRLSADEIAGKGLIEQLFRNHQRGTAGFAVVPQGTPTNNTAAVASGYSPSEDADESFTLVFDNPPPLVADPDPDARLDGQWLAELLGIDLAVFDRTNHSRGHDQSEARSMNAVLWPATWGYFLETMLKPVLDAEAIDQARWFFTNFVTGRGTVPAIRIGDQPYGILPTTTLSRMTWLEDDGWRPPRGWDHPEGSRAFLARMDGLLRVARTDWKTMADQVPFVGKAGDPHQILLDVVGLTPASIEFYQRYAESLEELANRLNLQGFGEVLLFALMAAGYPASGMALLDKLGYTGTEIPEVLEKFFLQEPNKLEGNIIDDRKLSESEPVRIYTPDNRNYLRWLIDAARVSFDTLRKQEGFIDDKPPTALLYLLLRYALEQGYWDAGIRLFEGAGILAGAEALTARLDPSFIHVGDRKRDAAVAQGAGILATSGKPLHLERASESRYEYLYRIEAAITGRNDRTIAQFIPGILGVSPATRYLDQQLAGLERLVGTPTARLERLLAEHLDLCTYRLDAWRWGLLHYALASLRYGGQGPARPGVYVGAYGWLEQVKSEQKVFTQADVPADLREVFDVKNGSPLTVDSTNGGFIHAPSLAHATAAAILRNGYISNATPAAPDALAVNLASARVRTALGMIEGVRNGQKLGALLGYQLERGLHDRHNLAEVDQFIYKLRKAFPLVADQLTDTQTADTEAIEAVEARNVVDGLALVKHIAQTGQTTYPFGKSLPAATGAQAAVINAEVDRMRDTHDAVADLAMAESVYQAVQGNHGRAGATLAAYAQGTFPPEPEVVQTPRTGLTLGHRVALQFEAGLDPTVSPNALPVTPRSYAEPALNKWLARLLPDPGLVVCQARYFDPVAETVRTIEITQADLALQPLDLLYALNLEGEQAMTELDDRVVHLVITGQGLRPDVDISIDYTGAVAGSFTMFEVGALIRSLRSLLLKSKTLSASDVTLPNEARRADAGALFVDARRITTPMAALGRLVQAGAADDLTDIIGEMDPLLDDPVANRNQILTAVDDWIDRLVGFVVRGWSFGVPGGVGFAYDWRKQRFQILLTRVREKVARWQEKLDECDAILASLPGLADDVERFAELRRAESLVSTTFTVPEPGTVALYQAAVEAKHDLFAATLSDLADILDTNSDTVEDLLDDIRAELPLDAFDRIELEIADQEDEVVRFAGDLHAAAEHLRAEVTNRRDAAQALVDQATADANPKTSAEVLVAASRAIFGEDFRMVPEFAVSVDQALDWEAAWNDRDTILTYATDPAGERRDFPVDDWLHGVARVREKLNAWENVVLVTSAFGGAEPELRPVQFPYRPDDRWLALPYPASTILEGDHLLYTAHYAVAFDPTTRQCGLLLDEWSEVIPNHEETTGITFQYDRPNSEPPQALLLAISPALRGAWRWEDLVDTLHETLDEARLRAVSPVQVDNQAYARFLPAAIMAATRHPITIGLNLAVNNNVLAVLPEGANG